ncbi:MAG: YqjK family protein [Pseudomonadota bacterium]
MNRRLAAIETKRARLIERAAREREDVVQTLQLWSQPLGLVDQFVAGAKYVMARPPLVAAAVIVLVVLRPRRAWKWARRALGLWQGYRWLTRRAAI